VGKAFVMVDRVRSFGGVGLVWRWTRIEKKVLALLGSSRQRWRHSNEP